MGFFLLVSDRINRIIMIFFVFITFLSQAPWAYALSELEALQAGSRWDESDETQSACSGMIIFKGPLENGIIKLFALCRYILTKAIAISRLSYPPASPERFVMAGRRKGKNEISKKSCKFCLIRKMYPLMCNFL